MSQWSRYNVSVLRDDGSVLLFNTRTGSLLKLSPERCRELHQLPLPADLRDLFVTEGFLVADDIDEIQQVAARHAAARDESDVLTVTIELTQACNFRCLYCYQPHNPLALKPAVRPRILHFLDRRLPELRHLHINWFGGEPLLRLDILAELSLAIQQRAAGAGCTVSQYITTNGYRISPAVASRLRELGVTNAQITLDGEQRSHDRLRPLASGAGSYERVVAGCVNVVEAGIELLLRINVNRWSAPGVDRLLADLGARGIGPHNAILHATRTVDHGNCGSVMSEAMYDADEFAHEWIEILGVALARGFNLPSLAPIAYNCPFDLDSAVMISADGRLLHCSSSGGQIADIGDDGDEVNRTELYELAKERDPLGDAECRGCLYLPMCMGGCAYLQGLGERKCMPERYVLPELIELAGKQMELAQSRMEEGGDKNGREGSRIGAC